ncbi:glycosyltransferase family 4 protein [Allopontixanthobacter sp.]|uniref:glycosyltransferase family 4 protein n=1 Tax=Allopontixanthobacter sp. TaxID=2906452 RepID=UPI002ABB2E62|nr:glycosyltransferase family 4 protein [Allopontixanthobacter sp.]MDZ4307488.1 glycosyltransferase family 4 protein [Allopontixanthobacter sp.]
MNVAVFHPGTQHSWQTATAVQQLGRLQFYATSIFYKPEEWPYRIERYLPGRLRQRVHDEFRRFEHPALDPELVKSAGLFEWLERIAARAGLEKTAVRLDLAGNRRFARFLEREIRSDREFALWGYNSSALESFELARDLGRFCILDRTNGDFRVYNRIMEEILGEYGDYFLPGHRRIPDWTIERDDREYAEADRIVVGSEFARATLAQGCPDPAVAKKTRVLNYCFDESLYADLPKPAPVPPGEPVRFLFLGQLIPRKGIHHVLEAIEQIPASQARLTLVGKMGVPKEAFARFADRVDFIPTVARADVPRIMSEHHVFLLPTYFEGAGIVLYEALASGMALIQSRNAALAATPDTGIMLEEIDTGSLLGAMMALVDDRNRLDHFRAHAQAEAQNYTFARYRSNIAKVLAEAGLGG